MRLLAALKKVIEILGIIIFVVGLVIAIVGDWLIKLVGGNNDFTIGESPIKRKSYGKQVSFNQFENKDRISL